MVVSDRKGFDWVVANWPIGRTISSKGLIEYKFLVEVGPLGAQWPWVISPLFNEWWPFVPPEAA